MCRIQPLKAFAAAISVATIAAGGALAAQKTDQVRVDISFEAQAQIRWARTLIERKNTEEAVRALQKVIEEVRTGAVPLGEGRYAGSAEYAVDLIRGMGPEARRLYAEFWGARAQRAFERAEDERDLWEVAVRWPLSAAAAKALNALGNLARDSGRPDRAAEIFLRILSECPEGAVDRVTVMVKRAVSLAEAGRTSEAEALWRELRSGHGDAPISLAGRRMNVNTIAARLRPTPAAAPPAAEWPTHLGSPAHAAAAAAPGGDLGRAWSYDFLHSPTTPLATSQFWPNPVPHVPYHPAVAGGTVYFHNSDHLWAVDLRTGDLRWKSYRYRPLLTKPVRRPYRGFDSYYTSYSGGRLHVRVGGRMSIYSSETRNDLEAYDAETGELLWTTRGRREFAGTTFLCDPTPEYGTVYAGGMGTTAGLSDYRLYALDAATGRLLWKTPIGSGVAGMKIASRWEGWFDVVSNGAPPAVAGGVVYCSTNVGSVAAVDAFTGRLLWVRSYEREILWRDSGSQMMKLFNREDNPPVVGPENVYFVPRDWGRLMAVKRLSGELAWEEPDPAPKRILGLAGGMVYVASSAGKVLALEAKTGTARWQADIPGRCALGDGVVTGSAVYVPTSAKLVVLDPATGKAARGMEHASAAAALGNLVPAAGGLVGFSENGFLARLNRYTPRAGEARERSEVAKPSRGPAGAAGAAGAGRARLGVPLVRKWSIEDVHARVLLPPKASDEVYLLREQRLVAVRASEKREVLWEVPVLPGVKFTRWWKDRLYLVYPKMLVAVDLAGGRRLWEYRLEAEKEGFIPHYGNWHDFEFVEANDRTVVIGRGESWLTLEAATGRLRWRQRMWGGIDGVGVSPGRGLVYRLQHHERKPNLVHAHDEMTGKHRWQIEIAKRGDYQRRHLFRDDEFVFTSSRGGQVRLFDLGRREMRWEGAIGRLNSAFAAQLRFSGDYLLIYNRHDHSGPNGGFVFDRRSGKKLAEAPCRHAWVAGDRAYFCGRKVTAFDLEAGRQLWATGVSSGDIRDVAVCSDGRHVVAMYGGSQYNTPYRARSSNLGITGYVLDAADGKVLWRSLLPGYTGFSGTYAGGLVFYGGTYGLTAFGARAGSGRAYRDRLVAERRGLMERAGTPADAAELRRLKEDLDLHSPPEADCPQLKFKPVLDGRPDEWVGLTPVRLADSSDWMIAEGGSRRIERRKWNGADDVSAEIRTGWRPDEGLYVCVIVSDDRHHSEHAGGQMWMGDSVQIALDGYDANKWTHAEVLYRANTCEFWMSLTGREAQIHRLFNAKAVEFAVGVMPDGRRVVYEALVPEAVLRPTRHHRFGRLGARQVPDRVGLGLAVNDNDGEGLKGWLEWGSGVGALKAPAMYGTLRLKK